MNNDLLLWFDLETTGLDENTGAILEVGWGITDVHLNWMMAPKSQCVDVPDLSIEIGRDEGEIRDVMLLGGSIDPYVVDMHKTSGLWGDILDGYTKPLLGIEIDVMLDIAEASTWMDPARGTPRVTMAGSGVSQFDMRWIAKHMPSLHKALTYYSIDMGTYTRVDSLLRTGEYRKASTTADHRALEDIVFSHNEALEFKEALQ